MSFEKKIEKCKIFIVVQAFMAMELIMNIIDAIMKNKEDKAETEHQEKTDKIYKC
jgi:hypothetical protein